MERRAFLQMLCIGIGAGAAIVPANAFTAFAPLAEPRDDPRLVPEAAVATPKDLEQSHIENAWYGHWRRVGRRHYRRVGRRHYRRVSRRVYRRHYYY